MEQRKSLPDYCYQANTKEKPYGDYIPLDFLEDFKMVKGEEDTTYLIFLVQQATSHTATIYPIKKRRFKNGKWRTLDASKEEVVEIDFNDLGVAWPGY